MRENPYLPKQKMRTMRFFPCQPQASLPHGRKNAYDKKGSQRIYAEYLPASICLPALFQQRQTGSKEKTRIAKTKSAYNALFCFSLRHFAAVARLSAAVLREAALFSRRNYLAMRRVIIAIPKVGLTAACAVR
ncbi:MAG TPA: hypothetical protein IAC72_04130 [Candidatus Fimimonas merdipullorum]|uniref:Uncharacterized protein n=1 Tax=Candidatus Fimimonas merdipullorum TaxID=2840822 RepID=A0A9D1SQ16_9BACT|nr:hypothetical protein [Candidatus Fimimonas merdipullorum]